MYLINGAGQWSGKKPNSQETTPPYTKLPGELNKSHNLPLIEKGGTGQTVAKKIAEQVCVFYAPHLVRSAAAHPS